MKFRLSSALLVVVILGILFAWYVDRTDRSRSDFTGVWYDIGMKGQMETLTIRRNGTFTKHYSYGFTTDTTYEGTYTIGDAGVITFHFASRKFYNSSTEQVATIPIDDVFRCLIARDSHHNLIVADVDSEWVLPNDRVPVVTVIEDHAEISWEKRYTALTRKEQRKSEIDKVLQIIDSTKSSDK